MSKPKTHLFKVGNATKEFIEMMRENRDIQRLWSARAGDFIWVKKEEDYETCDEEDGEGCVRVVFEDDELLESNLCFDCEISLARSTNYETIAKIVKLAEVPDAVWLPRQDQLQDIVRDKLGYTDAIGAVWKLYNAVGPNRSSPYGKARSLEQIWLFFVMKEKFGKVWNGKEWEQQ